MRTVDDGICWDFTSTCHECGETVQVTNGQRQPHPCPDAPALVVEGCNASTPLAERVEQALADYELLNAADRRP